MKVINIFTGAVLDVVPVDNNRRYVFESDLRKDGLPDKRAKRYLLGVRRIQNPADGILQPHHFSGHTVVLPVGYEQYADLHRAEIARLEAELAAAKVKLLQHYES